MRCFLEKAVRLLPLPVRPSPPCLSTLTSIVNHPYLDSLLSLLHRCKGLDQLYQIHAQTVTSGLIHDPFVATKLVEFAASFHILEGVNHAFSVADCIENAHTFTWNAVLRGYLKSTKPLEVMLVYGHLRKRGIQIDSFTSQFLIRACVTSPRPCEGKMVHAQVLKLGFGSGMIIQTALVKLYGCFGELECARQSFEEMSHRDLVSWNAVIAVHAQMGRPLDALWLSCAMITENFKANQITAVSMLSACSCLANLKLGKMVHGYAIKNITNMDVFVCNSLVGMYCKCSQLCTARRLFGQMSIRNVVSWTSLINGYTDNDLPESALSVFREMESQNVKPDQVAILGILSTCAKSGCYLLAEWVDDYVRRKGFEKNTTTANALIDMHAKCGNLRKACQVFDRMRPRTLVSWTAMIQGLSLHGHGKAALIRFTQMQREGFRPDGVAFQSVLHGCSHAGLVDEGRRCFISMVEEHGIAPTMEHYGCMVDLLCRAGFVSEAFEFVERMPVKPDAVVWRSLLGACKYHGNVALASRIMSVILELEPTHGGNYILLSNIYAANCQWDNVLELREDMGVRGPIKSNQGFSMIEV